MAAQTSIVRFELTPDGAGTRLIFSQTGLGGKSRTVMVDIAGGWHGMLDRLVALVGGSSAKQEARSGFPLRPHYRAVIDRMWASDDPDGVVRKRADGGFEIVFRRHIRKPLEKVWAALTVPERLADWLAAASIEPDLRVGARFTLQFAMNDFRVAGEIVELDPPRLIAWTWPGPDAGASTPPGVVRFELAPDGEGCVLTLTDGGAGNIHPNQAAGWHTHLEGLPGAADGVFTAWDREVEAVHEARYRAALERLVS